MTARMEDGLEDRLQDLEQSLLSPAIHDVRYAQTTLPTLGLADPDAPYVPRPVAAGEQIEARARIVPLEVGVCRIESDAYPTVAAQVVVHSHERRRVRRDGVLVVLQHQADAQFVRPRCDVLKSADCRIEGFGGGQVRTLIRCSCVVDGADPRNTEVRGKFQEFAEQSARFFTQPTRQVDRRRAVNAQERQAGVFQRPSQRAPGRRADLPRPEHVVAKRGQLLCFLSGDVEA